MSLDSCYDSMAEYYHLIFEDWDVSMARQGGVLADLLPPPDQCGIVLDCACGIGTQSIALATRGFQVEGSDLSAPAVARAEREARARGLSIRFRQDDMRYLESCPRDHFSCVLALDNSLPHLSSDGEVLSTLHAMHSRLRDKGLLLLSLRDYADHIVRKPKSTEPVMFNDGGGRRIIHQVWDWKDNRRYALHIFITVEAPSGHWTNHHFVSEYRAITTDEVVRLTRESGFQDVEVMDALTTGFYQPIIRARKSA